MSTLSSLTYKSCPVFFLNHFFQLLIEARKITKRYLFFYTKKIPLVHTMMLEIFV